MDAIVYTSNAGHTKEYAELLSNAIGIPAYSMEAADSKLEKGSRIIYMGWIMAGSVKGYKAAASKYDIKALCPVGMTARGVERSLLAQKHPIPDELKVFYLQGGFELDKVHGLYKFMMSLMRGTVRKNLKNLPERTDEENEMLDMMTYGMNTVSEDKLAAVIEWYKGLEG